jgi:hypothetical protein
MSITGSASQERGNFPNIPIPLILVLVIGFPLLVVLLVSNSANSAGVATPVIPAQWEYGLELSPDACALLVTLITEESVATGSGHFLSVSSLPNSTSYPGLNFGSALDMLTMVCGWSSSGRTINNATLEEGYFLNPPVAAP